MVPVLDEDFSESNHFFATLLRSIGYKSRKSMDFSYIAPLTETSDQNEMTFDSINARLSDYYVPGWADTRWQYRKNITIDSTKVNADLTNFPVYIDLYDSDLLQDAQASGNDIFFTDDQGNLLDHEIESYERVYNSSHACLIAWVKANISSSQNTILSIYYGNPTADNQENPSTVWDDAYKGVWHLRENQSGVGSNNLYEDSTINFNDGDDHVSATGKEGQIDGGQEFDGSDDYIYASDIDVTHLTISAWIKPQDWGLGSEDYIHQIVGDENLDLGKATLSFRIGSQGLESYKQKLGLGINISGTWSDFESQSNLLVDTWQYIVVTFDGNDIKFYIDGNHDRTQSNSGSISNFVNEWVIGYVLQPGFRCFDGYIDELRIADTSFTADWIQTEYNNQKSPKTFYSINTKEIYGADEDWALPALKYRKNVTVLASKVSGSGNLIDFPVLIDLYDEDLHSTDKVQSNGEDIVFVDSTGTQLNHEFELFDQTYNSTHAHLIAWVRVPSLSGTSNTTLALYYGNKVVTNQENPTAVWDGNFEGVWHFEEIIGDAEDSTINSNDGTLRNNPSQGIDGQVGYSYEFDGVDDYISLTNSITQSTGTYSFWIYPHNTTGEFNIIASSDNDRRIHIYNGKIRVETNTNGEYFEFTSSSLTTDTWQYVAFARAGDIGDLYIDGSWVQQVETAGANSLTVNSIAGTVDVNRMVNGTIDEVRISSTTRSEDWIVTEYNNQFDPSSFYIISNEEEYRSWFRDASFDYRKDILIDKSKIGKSTDVLTLRPNGVGYSSMLSVSGASSNWEAVDEENYDTNTYVHYNLGTWAADYYATENTPGGLSTADINSVTIKFRGIYVPGNVGAEGRTQLRTHSSFYSGTVHSLGLVYTNIYSEEYQTNPNTGEAWTWTEVNDMQIGVSVHGVLLGDEARVTQIWAEINYTKNENLDNFPYLLDITTTSFKSGKVQSDLNDILFTDVNGTKLAHEIESFTQSSTDGHLLVWVNIPKLSAIEDTLISMYYGNNEISNQQNPEQVWSSNYRAVYHMDESPVAASSSSFILRPNADGTYEELTPSPSGSNWENVDEESADEDTTHVSWTSMAPSIARREDSYNIENPTIGLGRIDKITVYVRGKVNSIPMGTPKIRTLIRTYNTDYFGTDTDLTTSYNDYDTEYTLNPETNTLWTWEEINSLEVGVQLGSLYGMVTKATQVWIEVEYTPASLIDSTGNDVDLTSEGAMSSGDVVDAMIAKGIDFDGSNDGLSTSTTTTVDDLTVSAWIYVPSGQSGWHTIFVISKTEGSFRDFCLVDRQLTVDGDSVSHTFGSALTVNRWHYITFTFDGSTIRGYINGTYTGDSVSAGWGSITGFITAGYLHQWGFPVDNYGGILDEIRLTDDTKTDSWISTEFENQQNPSSFFTLGPEIVIDKLPPVINDFGVDDQGTGTGKFWADVTDSTSDVASVTVEINGTEYGMSYNGTFWIYQMSVTYLANYNYQIVNASDNWENYITSPSSVKNHTFNLDNVSPIVDDWDYDPDTGEYGTFNANVSDSWGVIDTVIVNVTEGTVPQGERWAFMQSTAGGYINDTIILDSGSIKFVITVNDTAGNSFTSSEHQGYVPIVNHFPVAENLTLSRDPSSVLLPVNSNNTLYLDYDFYDQDDDSEGGTEIRWYKNNILQSAYNDETFIPSSALVKGDEWNATVRPKDGQDFGEINNTAIITIQNTAPLANNLDLSPTNPVTGSDLTADYDYSDVDSDPESGTQIIWYKDGALQGVLNDSTSVASSYTSKGEEWHFKVSPNDGEDFGLWVSVDANVTIGNTNPLANNLDLSPSSPINGSNLTASYDYSDADSDGESGSEIRWYKNGVLKGNLNDSLTVQAGNTSKGENWYFTIRPNDGTDFGDLQQSSSVTIGNTAPTANDVSISPTTPLTGDTLTVSYTYFDDDYDGQSGTQITWYKDGVLQGALNDSTEVAASYTSKGEEWHYKVRPSDGTDYGNWVDCLTNKTIGNTAPIVNNLDLSPTNPVTGSDLTADYDYSDVDSDPESGTQIIWYKDGFLQGILNDSTGVAASYTSKGEEWHFKVRPNDGEDLGNWVSVGTNITIGNTAPTAYNLDLSPSNPITGNDLTADYDYSDADLEEETGSEIRWYKNGVLQGSLNNSLSVQAGNTSKGENWYFTIRPNDGTEFGDLQQSSSVTIGNTTPTASDVTISPTTPLTGDTLTASYTYFDEDSDAQSGTQIIWYKDGVLQGALNDSTEVAASYTSKGEEWHYKVRPSDGTDYGNWVDCLTNKTIGNTAPTANNLEISPSNPTTSDSLTCSYDWTDSDPGDVESGTLIRWYKDGIVQPALDDLSIITAGNTSKTEIWHFKIQPSDGSTPGSWYSCSVNVTISNTAPEVSNVKINEISPVANSSDLTVDYLYFDYDGDLQNNVSREIHWYRDGSLVPSLNDSIIIGNGNTTVGDIWYFTIQVSDGTNLSTLKTSASVSIVTNPNTLPEASSLNFTNANPTTSDYLYINYTYTDDDSDPESGTMFYWYRNGNYQSQYDGLRNLSASATTKGDEWHVQVKPRDGKEFGNIVGVSINVTIGNTAPTASELIISPSDPKTANDLSVSYTFNDLDSDSESGSEIIWYKDGILQGTLNDSIIIQAGNTSKGEEWHFKVRPYDDFDYGDWTSSPINVTIGNTAPAVSNLEVTPGGAKTGNDLSATYDFSDPDNDGEGNSHIRWFRNGVEILAFENLTLIPAINTSKGQTWYFVIQPADSNDYGNERTSAAVTILNTAPTASNLVILPGTPNTTLSLSVSYDWFDPDNATDSDSGSSIFWYKDGVLQGVLNNSLTVASSYTSKGEEWHFKVQPKDGIDFGLLASCTSNVTILNSAPSSSDLSISPSDPKTLNDLMATYTYIDADMDGESGTEYQWFKDGVLQGALISSTVPSALTSRAEEWHFKVRPSDGVAFGVWNSCPTNITIQNTMPSADNIEISPTDPKTGDTLSLIYSYSDIDGDSEGTSYIRWYKNDIEQISLRNQTTVSETETGKGQTWYVTVLPYDSTDYGVLKISLVIAIDNTPPSASNLEFLPIEPKGGNDLSVTYSYSDADFDTESGTLIRWYRNGILQAAYNDSTIIDKALVVKGETWNVSIKVSDGTDFGGWENTSITIANSAPSVVAFTPEIYTPSAGLFTTSPLVATWDDIDPDGDNITDFIIVWYQNLNPIPGLENITEVASNYTTKHDDWRFYINVFDGEDWSDPLGDPTSWKYGSTTIDNSEPFVENITLSGGLTTTDDILLSYDFYDADGDPENSKIEWKIIHQGSVDTVEGTTVLSEVEFTAGDLIWVVITPDDNDGGMLTGQPVDSSTLSGSDVIKQVGDTAPEINTTQEIPTILADHPNGTFIYSAIFPIYLNYTLLIVDIDSGESDDVFDVEFQANSDVQYANISENIGAQYRWFKYNSTSGKWELQEELTSSVVSEYYLSKDEQWMGSVRPRDNYGYFGAWVNTSSIIIGNSYPEIRDFNWLVSSPTTSDDLFFSFDYFDWDGDPIVMSETFILWFKNGLIINGVENNSILSSLYFVKGDEISVIIRPFDGTNWAVTNYTSASIFIVNSRPTVTSTDLLPVNINGNNVLNLNWSYFDIDGDPEHSSYRLHWYKNGENQTSLANLISIPAEYLSNDDLWQAQLWVYDGTNYSVMLGIPILTKVLSLEFVFDEQSSQVDPGIRYDEFYVVDENITISYLFTIPNDAENSRIQWYKKVNDTWIEQVALENLTMVSYGETVIGEQWYCTITPFDALTGYSWFSINSSVMTVESRPIMVSEMNDVMTTMNDTECHYIFDIITEDLKNEISSVELSFNDTFLEVADPSLLKEDEWKVDFEITDSLVKSYLNSIMVVKIKIITEVEYSGQKFEIYSLYTFNFTVRDEVAPRVTEPRWIYDNADDPTNITFFAGVLDHGSDITGVTLYYYFKETNTTQNGNGASISQLANYDYRSTEMVYHNTTASGVPIYSITVPFDHNGTSREILYYIMTADSSGNSGVAYDIIRDEPDRIPETTFYYKPPGIDPMLVILIVGVTIIIAIFGSLVYVKFIRKPELIGLDKELVISSMSDVSDTEIRDTMDLHTIGVVISFFDQRHGPIPIIVEPEMLRDNFTKLVELSDRSFSGTGFSDDFDSEITSSYDFVLTQGVRTKVMSFGYALDVPEARGGQENITANILVHTELFPLVNQFLDEVQAEIHQIHLLMNDASQGNEKVKKKVITLRKFVSRIVLTYERIYGTTDLIEEDSKK
jgi:hypothetical protein